MTFFRNESSRVLVNISKSSIGWGKTQAKADVDSTIDYAVLIYTGLGIGGSGPLLISGINVIVGGLESVVNSMLIHRVGRKALFIIGLAGCLVSLISTAILTKLYTGTTNTAGSSAIIFAIVLHLTL